MEHNGESFFFRSGLRQEALCLLHFRDIVKQ